MNDTLGIVAMLVMMMTIIPLVGVIMAITPYLMKKSEWFTVTVPEIAQQDPFLRGLRKRYLITMLLVTAVLTGLGIATAFVESELAAIVLLSGGTLGIVVGGSGNGEQIAANKVTGVRAALAWTEETARLARQHNNANILCFGARVVGTELAKMLVDVWLDAEFEGRRHKTRVDMIDGIME